MPSSPTQDRLTRTTYLASTDVLERWVWGKAGWRIESGIGRIAFIVITGLGRKTLVFSLTEAVRCPMVSQHCWSRVDICGMQKQESFGWSWSVRDGFQHHRFGGAMLSPRRLVWSTLCGRFGFYLLDFLIPTINCFLPRINSYRWVRLSMVWALPPSASAHVLCWLVLRIELRNWWIVCHWVRSTVASSTSGQWQSSARSKLSRFNSSIQLIVRFSCASTKRFWIWWCECFNSILMDSLGLNFLKVSVLVPFWLGSSCVESNGLFGAMSAAMPFLTRQLPRSVCDRCRLNTRSALCVFYRPLATSRWIGRNSGSEKLDSSQ